MVEEENVEKTPFENTAFGKTLLVIWEIIYYGVIYLIGVTLVYGGSKDVDVPQFLLFIVLTGLLTQHKTLKQDYKYWESIAPDDEFYRSFIKRYKVVPLLPIIVAFFIFAHYCSIGTFIILYVVATAYDLWDRRYITNDIKHDMILRKLNKYDN